MKNYRIQGQFRTLSPLSHIGDSISTNTYLVEEPIIQDDGSIESVFSYSGNAWRGQLRDLAAQYMLEKINATVSLDAFHLLFSGGKIGGKQVIDLDQVRNMRKYVPLVGLFGGGIGNQLVQGKMRVGSSYPVCKETAFMLPPELKKMATSLSYADMTLEKSFTRFDDSKNNDLIDHVRFDDLPLIGSDKKKGDDVSTQMRMTSELLAAGVVLYHQVDLLAATEQELGCLVSALTRFADSPFIGGQCNKGHGQVMYQCLLDNQTLLTVQNSSVELSDEAENAKESYDRLLLEQYDKFLADNTSDIAKLLGSP